jgi:hypothetical protein
LSIESTIQEIDSPRRIVWSGAAQGIMARHVWSMTPSEEDKVLVHTEESWDGDPVLTRPEEEMRQALEGALRAWLQSLKHKAEAQPHKVDNSGKWRGFRTRTNQRRALE